MPRRQCQQLRDLSTIRPEEFRLGAFEDIRCAPLTADGSFPERAGERPRGTRRQAGAWGPVDPFPPAVRRPHRDRLGTSGGLSAAPKGRGQRTPGTRLPPSPARWFAGEVAKRVSQRTSRRALLVGDQDVHEYSELGLPERAQLAGDRDGRRAAVAHDRDVEARPLALEVAPLAADERRL